MRRGFGRTIGFALATSTLLAGCSVTGHGNASVLSKATITQYEHSCLSSIDSDTNPVPQMFKPSAASITEVATTSLAVVYRNGRRAEWCWANQGGYGGMGSYEVWHQRHPLDVLSAVYLDDHPGPVPGRGVHIWSLLLVSPSISRLQVVAPGAIVQTWRDGPRVVLLSIDSSSIAADASGPVAAAEVVGISAANTVVSAVPVAVCPRTAESFFNLCGVSRHVSLSQLWSTPL
jgi:hypothetical protein